MRCEKLQRDHENLLKQRFSELKLLISEYSFANLYLFREKHSYEVIFADDVYIKGVTYDGKEHVMPTSKEGAIALVTNDVLTTGKMIFPIPDEWLQLYSESNFFRTYSDDDSDYLFTTQKLADFSGRHLSKKRNLVKQFHEFYESSVRVLNNDTVNDALSVLDMWLLQSNQPSHLVDYDSCKEAIVAHKELGLVGYVYYVDQIPRGIMIGESPHSDLFIIHFSKADSSIKGLYQYMFQDCAIRSSIYPYTNMEQDVGIEELRHTKHSYQPLAILKKFRVFHKA